MSLCSTTCAAPQVIHKRCGELCAHSTLCSRLLKKASEDVFSPWYTPFKRSAKRGRQAEVQHEAGTIQRKNTKKKPKQTKNNNKKTTANQHWWGEQQELEEQQSISIAGNRAMSATAPEIDFLPFTMPFSEGNWGPYCYLWWSQLDLQRFP